MARILYFANGAMPDPRVMSLGADARVLQVTRMLQQAGHEVVVSCDTFRFSEAGLLDQLPRELVELSHSLHPKEAICARVKPDIVYFGSFLAYDESWTPSVPTIVEMGGPTLLETAFNENIIGPDLYGRMVGELNALAKADLVVVYGERQQWYYRLPLVLAGYDLDRPAPMVVVPPAVDESIIAPRPMPTVPRFVYSGGIYPWTDPVTAVLGVIEELDRRAAGEFHLIGGLAGKHPIASERARVIRERMATSGRTRTHDFMTYHKLVDLLRTMSVSVEIMAPNLERDLALPFRTPLSLACGLPVIYPDYAETAGMIRDYDAGWVGAPDDASWIRATVAGILENPDVLAKKSENAQRLARERFSCASAIGPLLDFLREPKRRVASRRAVLAQDALFWWTPAEKRLLLNLRRPALKWIRHVASKVIGRKG